MTTDNVKQPPDTDVVERLRQAMCSNGTKCTRDWVVVAITEPAEVAGLVIVDASRLAILDRYDEERKEWEAKVAGFKTAAEMWHREYRGTLKAIGEATAEAEENIGLRNERQQEVERLEGCVDTLRSQVTALTEERDVSTVLIENMKRHIEQAEARADRAEKELDEAIEKATIAENAYRHLRDCGQEACTVVPWCMKHLHAQSRDVIVKRIDERDRARDQRDRAIAERDDLGCQLEALRSIQRGDVADLRTRMEAMERWRAECESVPPHDDPYRGPADEREAVNEALYSADNALLRVEDWMARTALEADAFDALSYVSPALSKVRTAIDVINGADEREPLNDDEKGGA